MQPFQPQEQVVENLRAQGILPPIGTNSETATDLYERHLCYIIQEIVPGLRDEYSFTDYDHLEHDIHHVHECHVAVHLREAEELSHNGDVNGAMGKVIGAMYSLVRLHRRLRERLV